MERRGREEKWVRGDGEGDSGEIEEVSSRCKGCVVTVAKDVNNKDI